jgi:hypothetical protein
MRTLPLTRLAVGLTATLIALTLVGSAMAVDGGLSVQSARPPIPPKPGGDFAEPPQVPRVQGDTVGDPFVIDYLPFWGAGNTCSFNNDYDYACPYTGSTAPDVVYKYVCTFSWGVGIDLCQSTYDTKVYVYQNAVGTPIACNDDYCEWQSFLGNVWFMAGTTYYIVVDGYGSSCGDYYIDVYYWGSSAIFECPPGAILEGEGDCYENYNDTYNGGCYAEPFPVFQMIAPSDDPITICGSTGVYMVDTLTYRDTDWFQCDVTETSYICLAGDAEVRCSFRIIDGRSGCDGAIVVYGVAGPLSPISNLCYNCDVGTWWMWVGPNSWDPSYACGSDYWIEISGYTCGAPSPTTDTTWGRVKGLFR